MARFEFAAGFVSKASICPPSPAVVDAGDLAWCFVHSTTAGKVRFERPKGRGAYGRVNPTTIKAGQGGAGEYRSAAMVD